MVIMGYILSMPRARAILLTLAITVGGGRVSAAEQPQYRLRVTTTERGHTFVIYPPWGSRFGVLKGASISRKPDGNTLALKGKASLEIISDSGQVTVVRADQLVLERAPIAAEHIAWRGALEEALAKDQRYRESSSESESSLAKQSEIDKRNLGTLKQAIQAIGFPTPMLVGPRAADAAFLILQHADLASQKKYYLAFKQAATRNEVSLEQLALLEDRIAVGEGRLQTYGTQLFIAPDGKQQFYPIREPRNVNRRRAKVGLGPIEEYQRIMSGPSH